MERESEALTDRLHNLKARLMLNRLAIQVTLDAEAFRLLTHAELYLIDREAYEANRLGVLAAHERQIEEFHAGLVN